MAKNAHLTYDERLTIQSSLADHLSFKAIGLIIGKDPSTISKEVKSHIKIVETSAFNPCLYKQPGLMIEFRIDRGRRHSMLFCLLANTYHRDGCMSRAPAIPNLAILHRMSVQAVTIHNGVSLRYNLNLCFYGISLMLNSLTYLEMLQMHKFKQYENISTLQAETLILLQSLIYGFGDPISKIAFEVTPIYTMMTVRYLIAFVFSFAVFHRRIIRTVRTVPVKSWLIPGVCISMYYVLNNVALALTDATSVAFLRSLSIVITPAFAFLIYHTSYRWQHIILQILVLPGMYLLCVKGGLSGFGAGEVVSVIAAFMSAGALVFSKRYLDEVDPASMTCLMAGCSAVLALAGSLMFEGGIHLEATTSLAWAIILYLALMCTFLGYLLQNLALMKISDRSVALIQSLCPVMTAVFSFLLLRETLSPAGIAGAGIIVACVALANAIKS